MRTSACLVLAGVLLGASASTAAGQSCAGARLDVADWALVRSADIPGFTLRLPRAFTRDSTIPASAALPASRTAWWRDATRGRLGLIRSVHDSSSHAELASAGGRSGYLRCEERVGSAVAVIVHYDAVAPGNQNGPFIVRARIRWPDGEELDIRGDAPDRDHLAQLLTAVRTIRRAGA
ncbi:MAG: hypothetical protein JF589_08475 [Gemmatimonadetes bacterium]|nr:hypothetical protein [Gemmatimonadota bacterium]